MTFIFSVNGSFKGGLYEEAVSYFESFLRFSNIRSEIQLQALDKLARANFGNSAMKHPNGDTIQLLNDSINSKADEYINSLRYDNNQLLFTRRFQADSVGLGNLLSEKFFVSNRIGANWQENIALELNWTGVDQIGALTISSDGNTMYFAACGATDGFGSCDIYTSDFVNNRWIEPRNLGEKVNSTGWDSQPCISADGSQLYFVSKRKGGLGGSDIWKSVKLQDGSWSEAINPGDVLNTSGNEMAPYLHADGKTLYFSSTGHLGMGKADLFVSRLDRAERWSKPTNLGYPVNTKDDEINIVFNSDGMQAFISANKMTGFGGFDIYSVLPDEKNKPEAISFVKVIVRDSVSGKPLSVEYKILDIFSSAEMVLGQTDEISGTFLQALPNEKQYSLLVRKPGYCIHTAHFNLEKRDDNQPLLLEILLVPIKVGSTVLLNNVFFDIDKAEIKPESFTELDQVVEFLHSNTTLKIELGGHTDADGDAQYNLKLSFERATAVRNYLIGKGIPERRMHAIGYGSGMPVASNQTAEGKALNRRTEFKIIENKND